MSKRFTEEQYAAYWATTHKQTQNDLAAVCFPDKPVYFNRFFDRIQKHILNRYFREVHLDFTGKSLLDVGCGRGRWLEFYQQQKGANVTGIDLSEVAIAACQAQHFQAVQGSIAEMPFSAETFDFVNSITVLLHLPYEIKAQAVREIGRVLKPGGKALLIETTWEDPSPHVYGMPVAGWEALFQGAGMRLTHRSAHCFNLFRRRLPERLPFHDFLSIALDYPMEYVLMKQTYSKGSEHGMQHFMVFEK